MSSTRIGPVLDSQQIEQIERNRGAGAIFDRILPVAVCSLLIFGPLAFGAVEEWSILALGLGCALLVVLWCIRQFVAGTLTIRTPLAIPMAIFASVVLSQVLLGTSAYRYATVQSALLYVSFAALCIITTNTLRDSTDDRNFWIMLTTFGSLLSLFAIAQHLTSSGKLYWIIEAHNGSVFGPYVNRNHYAGLMEMLAPLPLVMCMRRDIENGQRVLLGFGGALMALSVLMSQSRGGILALCIELVLIGAAVLRSRNRRAAMSIVLAAVAAIGLLVWVGSAGDVATRLGTLSQPLQDSTGGNRLAIVRDSVPMIKERPITGWGLGTFPTVYPRFRTFYTDLFVNEAHNDYLQMLVETGLIGFGAFAAFLVVALRVGLRNCRHWQVRQSHALTLAALLGISGILVHSLFDFNLQIPANAALFYAMCGVAVRPSRHPDRHFD